MSAKNVLIIGMIVLVCILFAWHGALSDVRISDSPYAPAFGQVSSAQAAHNRTVTNITYGLGFALTLAFLPIAIVIFRKKRK